MIHCSKRRLKAVPLTALIGALIGCVADSGNALVESFEPPEACVHVPGTSRWAADGAHQETARVGDGDDLWFSSIGGVYWSDDRLYVFDMGNARVVSLTSNLSFVKSFGREGEGPGEFQRLRIPPYRPWRRLHGNDGRIVVYEGHRVSLFDLEGEYQANLITNPYSTGLSAQLRGVRLTPSGLLFDWLGPDSRDRRRGEADSSMYHVRRWHDGMVTKVLDLLVAALPHDHSGVPFTGPNQAVPLWDVAGGCVIASDGASPWLIVASLDGASADTLFFDLPDRAPQDIDRAALEVLSGAAGGARRIPEPTAIRRIRDLIVDPDGHVWLLPIQPDPPPTAGVEVLRVSLGTGLMVVDTVPAFPVAFGPPGVYYATPRSPLDEMLIVRIEVDTTSQMPVVMLK